MIRSELLGSYEGLKWKATFAVFAAHEAAQPVKHSCLLYLLKGSIINSVGLSDFRCLKNSCKLEISVIEAHTVGSRTSRFKQILAMRFLATFIM